ncbi:MULTISPECIES: Bug family tripartite tricarboxylate transporter substrate binding protein [Achromobacter]|uniref:Bug family tripartite tricarboxylate transporter substrate binding protein n=1 Tax=Achromobacter TaxID=222 RepID=UPI0024489A10|nr:tripartite tricarboxylate transporter substrate binding protein [Achromobacter mucicolens]MDH1521286.1 tripartite tricarboxylate transporter substrate binding protein [Achromobacter mucicolens]
MKTLKRLLCGLGVSMICSGASLAADAYPTQPITLVNPYAAGGPADVLGRALARELEKQLGKPVIVENKAGGGAAIGANFVARAKPDGYTLLLGTSAAHVVTPLIQRTAYDGIKDFAFVTIVANQPNMLVVRSSLPVSTLPELIALARKEPGKINYASAGPGSSPHLGGELFRQQAKVDIMHIPYSGAAPAINDLVGGQVDMAVLNLAASVQFIRSGKLKALAYANPKRSALFPDVPTLAEAGVSGAESASWYSLAAPKGTPQAVLEKLNKAVQAVNQSPEYRKLMDAQGVELWTLTPQEATQYVEKDQLAMRKLVDSAGLTKK